VCGAYLSHTKFGLAKRVQLASKHRIHLLVAHLLATRDLKRKGREWGSAGGCFSLLKKKMQGPVARQRTCARMASSYSKGSIKGSSADSLGKKRIKVLARGEVDRYVASSASSYKFKTGVLCEESISRIRGGVWFATSNGVSCEIGPGKGKTGLEVNEVLPNHVRCYHHSRTYFASSTEPENYFFSHAGHRVPTRDGRS
jgi:hypothetical protein